MEERETVNRIRAVHYIAGILHNQQHDPFCRDCIAFSRSVAELRRMVTAAEAASSDLSLLLRRAQEMLQGIELREDAAGQKRAGRCRLPAGACFPKYAMAFLERLSE